MNNTVLQEKTRKILQDVFSSVSMHFTVVSVATGGPGIIYHKLKGGMQDTRKILQDVFSSGLHALHCCFYSNRWYWSWYYIP